MTSAPGANRGQQKGIAVTKTSVAAITPAELSRLAREERSRVVLASPCCADPMYEDGTDLERDAFTFMHRYMTMMLRTGGQMRGYPLESAIDYIAIQLGGLHHLRHARRVLCLLIDRQWLRLEVAQ